MPDWLETVLSYSPRDLLLFSEEVYWRLFALNNEALWPLPAAGLAAGLMLIALSVRPPEWAKRAVPLVLSGAFAISGGSFLWRYYLPVNPAVETAAWLFIAEAIVFLFMGIARGRTVLEEVVSDGSPAGEPIPIPGPRRIVGLALLAVAVAAYPLLAPLSGHPPMQAEVFALAPDPTAIATLGMLLATRRGWSALVLMAVPFLWCLASAATLATLGSWQAVLPLAAALAVPAVSIATRGRRGGSRQPSVEPGGTD